MFLFHNKKTANLDLYRKLGITFLVISLGIAGIVFYISFSWATVTVIPQGTSFKHSSVLTATGKPSGQDEIQGSVVKTELEAKGTFPVKERKKVISRLKGMMTVTNTTDRDQPLRTTTRFLSADGVLLRSTAPTLVPAHGNSEVPVAADKEGTLETFDTSHFKLPALWPGLQDKIYGKKFIHTQGGETEKGVITQDDLDAAKELLEGQLREKFKSLLSQQGILSHLTGPRMVFEQELVSISSKPKKGEEAESVEVALRASFSGVALDERALLEKIKEKLGQEVGNAYDLVTPKGSESEIQLMAINAASGTATLRVVSDATKVMSEGRGGFAREALVGLSQRQIIEYFNATGDIEEVRVRFYPWWVTRAPLLVDHITILVKKE